MRKVPFVQLHFNKLRQVKLEKKHISCSQVLFHSKNANKTISVILTGGNYRLLLSAQKIPYRTSLIRIRDGAEE